VVLVCGGSWWCGWVWWFDSLTHSSSSLTPFTLLTPPPHFTHSSLTPHSFHSAPLSTLLTHSLHSLLAPPLLAHSLTHSTHSLLLSSSHSLPTPSLPLLLLSLPIVSLLTPRCLLSYRASYTLMQRDNRFDVCCRMAPPT
jgi:hypothetical protein